MDWAHVVEPFCCVFLSFPAVVRRTDIRYLLTYLHLATCSYSISARYLGAELIITRISTNRTRGQKLGVHSPGFAHVRAYGADSQVIMRTILPLIV